MTIEQRIAELMSEGEELKQEIDASAEEVIEESVEVIEEDAAEELTEAAVSTVAKAHGFVKGTGMNKGSFVHPKTKETITPLHGGSQFGHSRADGSTIAAFKDKNSLEKHLHDRGYSKNESVEQEELMVDVSEDVAALINGEELSEEFKTKAATIFEAAVLGRVKSEVAKIEEAFAQKLEEQVAEGIAAEVEGLVEKVDGYLGYMAEQWMKDNEIALDRGIKSEILESFVSSLKGVFVEHNIDIPDEAVDMVAEMETKVAELEGKLNESETRNIELTKTLAEKQRADLIEAKCSGLTDTEVEKFKGLAEELVFEGAESFEGKLQVIRENYFDKKAAAPAGETFLTEDASIEKTVSGTMAKYAEFLARSK